MYGANQVLQNVLCFLKIVQNASFFAVLIFELSPLFLAGTLTRSHCRQRLILDWTSTAERSSQEYLLAARGPARVTMPLRNGVASDGMAGTGSMSAANPAAQPDMGGCTCRRSGCFSFSAAHSPHVVILCDCNDW